MEYELTKIKPGEDLSEVLPVREEIFGYGEDDLDEYGINILLKKDGEAAAVGRILLDPENDRIIIDQIGVRENLRGQGIGTETLDCLMDIARDSQTDEVWAKTRNKQDIMSFLEKHGFEEQGYFWMIKYIN